jgi:hypothetical protein
MSLFAVALLAPLAAAAAPEDRSNEPNEHAANERAAPNDRRGAPNDRIDPRADAEMRRMSKYLSGLKSFRFHADSMQELVSTEGEKIQFLADQKIAMRRPNHFRSDREDPLVDATLRYDGKRISVYGKRTGYYATAAAPARFGDAVEDLRVRYGIDAPAADLFVDDAYRGMMEDVTSGRYIGLEPIDGVLCHHLAFAGKEVDWQIWIQDGPRPLPRRYSITSKREAGEPVFSINMSKWEPNAAIAESAFVFQPPAGATEIEFRPMGPFRSKR